MIGHLIGTVTDPAYRRRGHGRAIMQGLLAWFTERQVARVDLYASHDGEPLYRELGFTNHPGPSLYWRDNRAVGRFAAENEGRLGRYAAQPT